MYDNGINQLMCIPRPDYKPGFSRAVLVDILCDLSKKTLQRSEHILFHMG